MTTADSAITGSKKRQNTWVIYASMFIMGGAGLAYEYTLSKLSSDLLGNSVQQWAIVIGVMMFFMGIGSDIQKYLNDDNLLEKFLGAEVLLALTGAWAPLIILFAYGAATDHFVFIQYFFIAAIGLLIGFEIPLLTRINAQYTNSLPANLGGILKMDYIGALCGALAWVFILPKFFDLVEMAFVLGLLNLATAAFAAFHFRAELSRTSWAAVGIVVASATLALGLSQSAGWAAHAEQYLYRDRIIHAQTSPFQHLVMTRSANDHIALYLNGHLQFNSADEAIYHEMLVHPAMHAAMRRERVLILGGGDGLAAREVLKYPDVKQITLCDLDPMVTELGRTHPELVRLNGGSLTNARVLTVENKAHLPSKEIDLYVHDQQSMHGDKFEKSSRIRIINIDAAKFVEQLPGKYDVVILDFPDPNAPELAKLYSKGFYTLLKRRLAPGAVLVQQSSSPYYAKEAYLNIGRTLESAGFAALPYHENVPSFGEWGWWIFTDGSKGEAGKHLKKRLAIDHFSVETRYLTPELLKAAFVFGKGQLESPREDVNTITNYSVYRDYLRGWDYAF